MGVGMAPDVEWYDWAGGREAMVRFGRSEGATVLAVPALFEEANRTRALLVDVLRRLARRGIAGALPDLPGQNESSVPTEEARLPLWRAALAAAASLPSPVHVVAIRGGALLDAEAKVASRWYLTPISGGAQVRELARVRAAGGGHDYAGNAIDAAMIAQLEAAEPATVPPLRVARLSGDPRASDVIFPAAPLWRSSEPRADPALAAAMADDIAAWVAACAG